jgi:DNA-binding MarR family transcriptional regulator
VAQERGWFDDAAFPALLRAARRAYGSAVRGALADAGYGDVPRNGSYVLAAIARTGAALSRIIEGLGVSKQAAGQLVDTLVARGYLDRAPDPQDRRRLTITLTERGQAAAGVIRSAVRQVDADLARRVGPEYVAHARATLAALIEAGNYAEGRGL